MLHSNLPTQSSQQAYEVVAIVMSKVSVAKARVGAGIELGSEDTSKSSWKHGIKNGAVLEIHAAFHNLPFL